MKYLFFALFIVNHGFADTLSDEVSSTAELRQEVELLSLEVENLKKSEQSEMDVYIQRDQEVSAQILKEKFRQDQINTQINLSRGKLQEKSRLVLKKGSYQWILEFWTKYENSLQRAHPAFSSKLLERISKLRLDLTFNKISYEHALLQTWFILESDLNKSQESEFILSPLQIESTLFHVEMVRMGRNKGYFRTAQGKYGLLFFKDGWKMNFFTDSSSIDLIETLLTQFKQQQKTGLHSLPGIHL